MVGAGAAGISLTRRLLAAGHAVVLLESGGLDYEKQTADLNRGDIVGTDYYRLEDARLRFVGGTTAIWGGRCTELDAIDFERRDYVPHSGWPFARDALESYYREAHAQFGLRETGPEALAAAGVEIPPFDPQLLRTPIWTFDAQSDRFTFAASRDLVDHPRCRVITHATVVSIDADMSGKSIHTVTAKAPNGCKLTVAADMFVLAAAASKIRGCCSRRARSSKTGWAIRTIRSAAISWSIRTPAAAGSITPRPGRCSRRSRAGTASPARISPR